MKKALLVMLSLPLLWLAWQVYDNSVRWGTSDPCGMVAERLRQDTFFDPEDPLGLNADWWRTQLTADLREDGALACWRSVLFDSPTESEQWFKDSRAARNVLDMWQSEDEQRRQLALLSIDDGDKLDAMLSLYTDDAVDFIRAGLAEYPNAQPTVEDAIKQHCRLFSATKAPQDCIREHHDMLGLKPFKPRPLG